MAWTLILVLFFSNVTILVDIKIIKKYIKKQHRLMSLYHLVADNKLRNPTFRRARIRELFSSSNWTGHYSQLGPKYVITMALRNVTLAPTPWRIAPRCPAASPTLEWFMPHPFTPYKSISCKYNRNILFPSENSRGVCAKWRIKFLRAVEVAVL